VTQADLIPLVETLKQARVLCMGDVMLDHYIHGEVERISPEAPVPVLHIQREERTLGGAGNVLRNLHALGVETCFISVTGTDAAGRELARMVANMGGAEAHVLAERGRTTPTRPFRSIPPRAIRPSPSTATIAAIVLPKVRTSS